MYFIIFIIGLMIGVILVRKDKYIPEEEHCPYCGKTSFCNMCNRCSDKKCNAGCIYCIDKR